MLDEVRFLYIREMEASSSCKALYGIAVPAKQSAGGIAVPVHKGDGS
jgi:hypothetical protein